MTVPAFLAFAVLMASGIAIFYALWIILMGFTFWFIKFDNNVTILQALIEAGRYPATVYPPWLRLIVSFIVPIALATTVPVQALRGELTWWQVVLFRPGGGYCRGCFATGVAGRCAAVQWGECVGKGRRAQARRRALLHQGSHDDTTAQGHTCGLWHSHPGSASGPLFSPASQPATCSAGRKGRLPYHG